MCDLVSSSIPGYEAISFHLEDAELSALINQVVIEVGYYANINDLTEYEMNGLLTSILENGSISDMVDRIIIKFAGEAEAYANGIMEEFEKEIGVYDYEGAGEEIPEDETSLIDEFGDMASIPIDKIQGQLDSIITSKSNELAASATSFIENIDY